VPKAYALALSHLEKLTIPQLEDLGEALFDFSQIADLEAWLAQQLN